MVGIPLWALAHIRIDGDGLPGDAAMGGYYLILEIFLRPILTLFGLIASITIFAALVNVLHEIWYLVVSNIAGFDLGKAGGAANKVSSIRMVRNAVDEFFFTVLYAIMCYMMAMSSFKLIDQIPNHILRWMGANVSTFGDQNQDPAENLVRNAFIGSNMATSNIQQAYQSAQSASQNLGRAAGEIAQRTGR
jgi:hypothetical protein